MSPSIHGKFRRAFITRAINEVDQNDAHFQSFSEGHKLIGTQGLRGCFVVIIATHLAAIVGHVGPSNIDRVMVKVKELYDAKKNTYFRDAEVWVVKATVPDASNEALGAARAAIVRKLAEIGLQNPRPASYSFHLGSHGNSPEFPDKGTVVGGLIDNKIEVWIENRLLRRW